MITGKILQNIPLSVLLELSEGAFDTCINTSVAIYNITTSSIHTGLSMIFSLIQSAWEKIVNFRPWSVVDAIFELQRRAMGRTSEALATVASGVDHTCQSASAAIHYLTGNSSHGLSIRNGHHSSRSSIFGNMGFGRTDSNRNVNEKLLRKLSKIDATSRVVSYMEWEDQVLSQQARARVQRMMHYEVSLRPFVATVSVKDEQKHVSGRRLRSSHNSVGLIDHHGSSFGSFSSQLQGSGSFDSSEDCTNSSVQTGTSSSLLTSDSPFMCTPKSFPPTPSSRSLVMARSTKFSEDVVYLARDQLRVEDGLESKHDRTRDMAQSLREGRRLAVFSASDTASGIALTCGQHCATKVGNVLYCSTRSMIPILRNEYVYFEMSVTPVGSNTMMQMASLSIGLSTTEMPLNTLVGAWKSSIGLCTTGQVLNAGQWCAPTNPILSSYGNNSVVGCLVRLDDSSAFETWDGVVVNANVAFNVNGNLVEPLLIPMGGYGTEVTTNPLNDEIGQWASGQTRNATISLFVPREEELFPTLTLHSQSQVFCHFCAADVFAANRESIGAPKGVMVYALDGSILLNASEDNI